MREPQNKLMSPLMLVLPFAVGHYTLDMNAYDFQIEFYLLQNQIDSVT